MKLPPYYARELARLKFVAAEKQQAADELYTAMGELAPRGDLEDEWLAADNDAVEASQAAAEMEKAITTIEALSDPAQGTFEELPDLLERFRAARNDLHAFKRKFLPSNFEVAVRNTRIPGIGTVFATHVRVYRPCVGWQDFPIEDVKPLPLLVT